MIRYESIIHEYDPWFNYRTTQYLINESLDALWNWFDPNSWYPLGRIVGATLYPGLSIISGMIYWILQFLGFPLNIRHICVFLAPIFSAFTSIIAYFMTKEIHNNPVSGLFSALFMALIPAYT